MRTTLCALAGVAAVATLAGCSGSAPPAPDTSASSAPPPLPARQLLAARAAQATALTFTATYALTDGKAQPAADTSASPSPSGAPPQAAQSVTIARTQDGYKLDIVSPTQVISLVHTGAGTYKCALSGATPGCTQVAAAGQSPPADDDFTLLKVFTSWPQQLASPATAISVSQAGNSVAATGACFDVDVVSASIAAPVDPGTYCYDTNGVLTGLRTASGTLKLVSSGQAPAAIALPAPLVANG
ncbi:hypothetical protein [Fodinicola acaciae]|uniref:hypothetical protein n=1 Tax=Fodinicola acaciae TaxID=2681555 RepID=UPI0013D51724|nr:hypothetical protein [Fodinicola acaciae]